MKTNTRALAIEWWDNLSALRQTQLCDTHTELIGGIRRRETLRVLEVEQIYLSEHPTHTVQGGSVEDAYNEFYKASQHKDTNDTGFLYFAGGASWKEASMQPLLKSHAELKRELGCCIMAFRSILRLEPHHQCKATFEDAKAAIDNANKIIQP